MRHTIVTVLQLIGCFGLYLGWLGICSRAIYWSATAYWFHVVLIWMMSYWPTIHVEVVGREQIPRSKAVLWCPNHVSYSNVPLSGLAAFPRQIHFLAKSELFQFWLAGLWIRAVGSFPLHKHRDDEHKSGDRKALKWAETRLAEGRAVGVFPQGKRSSQEQIGEIESGAAHLAIATKAMIVPVGIYYRKRGRCSYHVGIYIGGVIDGGSFNRTQREKLSELIKCHMAEALERAKRL